MFPIGKDLSKITTHVMYDMYWSPKGFEFDDFFQDPFIVDDKRFINSYNLEERISEWVAQIQEWADHYETSHLLVTMGNDFSYQNAEYIFVNLDILVKRTQELYPNIEVVYSTPSKYFEEREKEKSSYLTLSGSEFIPYADDKISYWTGFYSSW